LNFFYHLCIIGLLFDLSVVIPWLFLFFCFLTLWDNIVLVFFIQYFTKESMKMMGLSNWLHWTAWFIKYFLFLLISVAIETIFFVINTGKNGAVIGYTSPGILFVFLIAYTLATISFCFAISTFFSRGQ
jgi:hypothetical protein